MITIKKNETFLVIYNNRIETLKILDIYAEIDENLEHGKVFVKYEFTNKIGLSEISIFTHFLLKNRIKDAN